MKQDLVTTPNALKSMGGDVLTRLGSDSKAIVSVGYMTITEEYKRMLGDYFAMYGYKQNKIMNLGSNIRTRYYYNYIKTMGCNVTSKSNSPVPKKHLATIKAIFDKGTTLWHMDSQDVRMGDYSKDNTEV